MTNSTGSVDQMVRRVTSRLRASASTLARRLTATDGRNQLTIDDVRSINARLADALRSGERSKLNELAARVTVSLDNTDHARATRALREHGIVIVTDVLGSETADRLAVDIEHTTTDYASKSADSGEFEDDNVLVLRGNDRQFSYDQLAGSAKPVVQVRPGQDAGMIDVFNVDRLFAESALEVRACFETDAVAQLIRDSGYDVAARNFNCYVNRGITDTRGFHVDSYSPQIKAFIYLTDVHTLDDGPYTFVLGSHTDSVYQRANRQLATSLPNGTEAPFVPWDSVLPVLGSRGTLVISDQSGFHRGFPQAPHGRRIVAVMNYKSPH